MNDVVEILETPWRGKLLERVRKVESELIVCAPYFSEQVITQILDNAKVKAKVRFSVGFTRDSLKGGQSELRALLKIIDSYPNVEARHIDNLHAKVYVFDGKSAIVTSSNPTAKGLEKNIEFGVCLGGQCASQLRDRVMAYWDDAVVLDSDWLRQHEDFLNEVNTNLKRKDANDAEGRIGKYVHPKGTDAGEEWALLWSTHGGDHIAKHMTQIQEQGATLWGADFAIKPERFTFPLRAYLYVTLYRGDIGAQHLGNVKFRAMIANIETYAEKRKPKEIHFRPVAYKGENHKTYLKLTELKPLKSSMDVTSFKKHDGKNVSRYGLQGYVRVIDPHLTF